jgi:transcriptional regulator with XRE-family HTH domain
LVEYLREYAQKKGLDTTRKFADAVGIAKTTADSLLKGRPPKPETLEKIADNTGLPLRRLRELADLPPEVREPMVLGPESAYLTPSQRRFLHNLSREFDKLNRAGATRGDGS